MLTPTHWHLGLDNQTLDIGNWLEISGDTKSGDTAGGGGVQCEVVVAVSAVVIIEIVSMQRVESAGSAVGGSHWRESLDGLQHGRDVASA